MRLIRFFIRLTVSLIIVLFLISFTTYIVFLLPPVQNTVRTNVESLLSSLVKGEITIGSIQINVFTGIFAQDIKLYDPSNPDNSISVENVTMNYWLPSLLNKKFKISSIKGKQISGNIELSAQSKKTLPFLPYPDTSGSSETSGSDWQVIFGDIDLENFSLAFKDTSHNIKTDIFNSSANLQYLPQTGFFKGNISIPEGNLKSEYWNGSIDKITADFNIGSSQLFIDSLDFYGSGTSITATGTIPYSSRQTMSIAVIFSSPLAPINQSQFLPRLESQGNITGTSFLKGTISKPDWNFKIFINDIIMYEIPIQSVKIDASVLNDSINATANFKSSGLSGKGDFSAKIDSILLNSDFKGYTAQLNLDTFNTYLLRNFDESLAAIPSGNINLRSHFISTTSASPDTINLTAEYSSNMFNPSVRIQGEMIYNNWFLNGYWGKNFTYANGVINKTGDISGSATANINQPDLISNLFFNETIKGKAIIHSDIKFINDKFYAFSQITSDSLFWKTIEVTNLFGEISIGPGRTDVDTIISTIKGNIDSLLPTFPFNNASGSFQALISGSGPLKNPYVNLYLHGSQLSYNSLFFADTLYGIVKISGIDSLNWNDLTISGNDSKIVMDGSFNRNSKQSVLSDITFFSNRENNWYSSGIINLTAINDNNRISARFNANNASLDVVSSFITNMKPFSGYINAIGELNGPETNPTGNLKFKAGKFTFQSFLLDTIIGNLKLRDSLILTDISVFFPDTSASSLFITSELPLLPGKGWILDTIGKRNQYINIKSNNFQLSVLDPFFPEILTGYGSSIFNLDLRYFNRVWNMNGTVTAAIDRIRYLPLNIYANSVNVSGNISGTIQSPKITFNLSSGNILLESQKIISFYCNGLFEESIVNLDSCQALFENNGLLQFSGSIPLFIVDSSSILPEFQYNIQNIPLSIFNPFLRPLQIEKGTLDGNGIISKKQGDFFSQGNLFISDGIISFGLDEFSSGPINGELLLSNDSIIIKSFEAQMEDGYLAVNGYSRIRENRLPVFDLNIRSQNSSFFVPDIIDVNVQSLNLEFITTDDRFNLGGTILLGETRFIRDIRINDLISRDAVYPDDPQNQGSPFLQMIDIAVELRLFENLFVDMNLGNFQLDGSIAISGPASSPDFIGEIQIIDGYIYYLDREFFVTNGVISNFNPLEFNPSFDITGSTDVIAYSASAAQTQSYEITILINGDLEKPKVDLTSTPPLSKPDVISVLTLGSTVGAVGTDLANRIGNLVGQEIIGLGTRKLERILNLQSINISGDIFNTTTGTGPEVTLTRRFSRRLIITYKTGFNDLLNPNFSAIFRVFPFLFLTGETNDQGNTNIGLRFKANR